MNIQDRSAPDLRGFQSLVLGAWQNPSPDFLEQLPIAIYACDAQGRILWFNTRLSIGAVNHRSM